MSDTDRQLPVFMCCAEVAQMLRISERTLEVWRLKNWGPRYIRVGSGGKVLYDLQVVIDWLKRHEHGPEG